jgi:hypothetical protein
MARPQWSILCALALVLAQCSEKNTAPDILPEGSSPMFDSAVYAAVSARLRDAFVLHDTAFCDSVLPWFDDPALARIHPDRVVDGFVSNLIGHDAPQPATKKRFDELVTHSGASVMRNWRDYLEARALQNAGARQQAIALFEPLLAHFEHDRDTVGIASVSKRIGNLYLELGDPTTAVAHLLRARSLEPRVDLRGTITATLGRCYALLVAIDSVRWCAARLNEYATDAQSTRRNDDRASVNATWLLHLAALAQPAKDSVLGALRQVAADGLHANDTALFIGDGGRVRFWNGTGLFNLTGQSSSSFNSSVYAIAHYQDTLYCGGFFSSPFAHVAKWNGTTYEALTSGCNAQAGVLSPFEDQLFVAGNFQLAGDSLVNHTALWNGQEWNRMGAGVNGDVFVHCYFQDTLYIGGRFTTANGQPASRVAKWNGTQWVRVGGTLNDYVNGMAVYHDQLYIGGTFTTPSRMARLEGNTWVPVGSGCNARVITMDVYNDTLFVGGEFTMAGGIAASRIAKWHLPARPVATFDAQNTTICVGECNTFTDLSPNGVADRLWQFPGGTPATSTDSVATVCYAEPGTYAVTLSVSNAGGTDMTTDASALQVAVCTGIRAQNERTGFSVWPNPARGLLTVAWNGQAPIRAMLFSSIGRSLNSFLLQPGTNALDVRGLNAGSYVLRTDDGRSHRVLLVE